MLYACFHIELRILPLLLLQTMREAHCLYTAHPYNLFWGGSGRLHVAWVCWEQQHAEHFIPAVLVRGEEWWKMKRMRKCLWFCFVLFYKCLFLITSLQEKLYAKYFFSQIQGYHSWFFIFWPFWMLQELDWVVRQGRSAVYWRRLVFSVFYQGSRYIRNCHVKWPDNPLSGYPKVCVYPLHSLLCWKPFWKHT